MEKTSQVITKIKSHVSMVSLKSSLVFKNEETIKLADATIKWNMTITYLL